MGQKKIDGATFREEQALTRAIWKRWLQMVIKSALPET
jgi:hypothetical protein